MGAASLVHGSSWKTEDLDIAGPSPISEEIILAVLARQESSSSTTCTGLQTKLDDDGTLVVESSHGFFVHVGLLEMGGGSIDTIYECEPCLREGCRIKGRIASLTDLLRLRAAALTCRQSDGDLLDFRWLFELVALAGKQLPGLDKEDTEDILKVREFKLDKLYRLVLAAVLGVNNFDIAMQLLAMQLLN